MSNKGYYMCPNCDEEYISDFPFVETSCLSCGKSLERTAILSKEEATELLEKWSRDIENLV